MKWVFERLRLLTPIWEHFTMAKATKAKTSKAKEDEKQQEVRVDEKPELFVPDGATLSFCAGQLRDRAVMAEQQVGALAPAPVLRAMADRFQEMAVAQ